MLRVGIVLFPGFQVMNLGMTSVLEFALARRQGGAVSSQPTVE